MSVVPVATVISAEVRPLLVSRRDYLTVDVLSHKDSSVSLCSSYVITFPFFC